MSKMQQIWAEAHPLKDGQVIPSGTEFIRAEGITGTVVSGLSIRVESNNIAVGGYEELYFRTLEPLPDTDDTGEAYFIVEDNGDILMYNREHSSRYGATLTGQQARNFARKLLEALDA